MRIAPAALLIVAACSSDGGGTPPAQPPPAGNFCELAPAAIVTAISSGLDPGLSLRNAQFIRSNDFEQAYFLSADLEGPGLSGSTDIATWVSNRTDGTGLIYSVDAVAEEFSDWGPGGQTDAGFSMSNDGARESQECAGA